MGFFRDGMRFPDRLKEKKALPAVLTALLAFLVFSGTLGHDLVWDDEPVIRYAARTVREGGLTSLVTAPFSTGVDGPVELSGYYRPVSLASMWVNAPADDPSPLPYHVVNVLLHVINSLLVFQLLSVLIPSGPAAFLGGLLFAAHPVHSESVAFVSGRTDLLAALFVLLVVLLWCRARASGDTSSRDNFIPAMALYLLACLSKEIAFVLPAVILTWAAALEKLADRGKRRWRLPGGKWFLGTTLVLAAVLLLRKVVVGVGTGPGFSRYAQLSDANLTSLLSDVAGNVLYYLRVMVFPWPLSVFYPPVPPGLSPVTVASAAAFLILCLALSGSRHRRIGILAGAWTLLFLFPVSGIVGLGQSVIAERFCYLPSVGVVMVMGYLLGMARPQSALKHLHTVLVIALVILFSAGSVRHAGRWKDDLTLFTNALHSGPVKVPTMYVSLGIAYKDRGETGLALEAFQQAVRMDPSFLRALLNLGVTQTELGFAEEALETFERARVLHPLDPAVWFNMGVALEELGRSAEAIDAYDRASGLDPGEPAALYSKGKLLSRLGRYRESMAAYEEVVRMDPEHVGAHLGIGRVYEREGRPDLAVEMFMKAIEIRPGETISYSDLGRVLLGSGRVMEAVQVYRMAASIDRGDAVVAEGLVLAWFKAGEETRAREYVAATESLDPELHRRLSDLLNRLTGRDGSGSGGGQGPEGPAGALSLDKKLPDK